MSKLLSILIVGLAAVSLAYADEGQDNTSTDEASKTAGLGLGDHEANAVTPDIDRREPRDDVGG